MKKIFIAVAMLSTVFVGAHEIETKKVDIEEQDLTCDCTDHDVNTSEEEVVVTPSLACSECDRGDRK